MILAYNVALAAYILAGHFDLGQDMAFKDFLDRSIHRELLSPPNLWFECSGRRRQGASLVILP